MKISILTVSLLFYLSKFFARLEQQRPVSISVLRKRQIKEIFPKTGSLWEQVIPCEQIQFQGTVEVPPSRSTLPKTGLPNHSVVLPV